jgi:hypothetical protein
MRLAYTCELRRAHIRGKKLVFTGNSFRGRE